MKLITLLLACLSAFALSNAVTINNLSASAQTSRTWAIHRYFADKEICGQPQPYTGGSAIANWQADVTSRWPADSACSGGYAKTAIVSFELTVAGSSSAVVEFRASSSGCNLGSVSTCTTAGMDSTAMLNFDAGGGAGSWGLKVLAVTGGITMGRSARTMIAAGQYQILKNGPVFTEVLVREGPQSVEGASTRATSFGWRCTANCTAPYDTATWVDDPNWYSIRPTFLLRFYRRWGRVEGDSVLQNAWIDRHVDQRMDSYAVMHGAGETTSCYTAPAAVVIPGRSTVWDGPCWSTDSGDATNTKVDLNPAYIIYSKAVPEYDSTKGISAAAISLELNNVDASPYGAGWNTTDKGVTTTATLSPHLGFGQWQMNASQGGGGHWVAVLPRGSARYLLSMENSLLDVVMGGARAYLHFPIAHLSPLTATFWPGYGRTSFGQPISLSAHPAFASANDSGSVTGDTLRAPGGAKVALGCATCMVTCQDTSGATLRWCSTKTANTVNKFGYDTDHTSNPFYVPWLVTGKQFLTEAMWHQAVWASSYVGTTNPMTDEHNDHVGAVGYIYGTIRTAVWTLRVKAAAAAATPDAFDAEKAYFTQMVTGAIALDEGRLAITNGAYPPPDPSNAGGRYGCANKSTWLYTDPLWCVGRYLFERGRANPVGFPHWVGVATPAPQSCSACRQDRASGQLSPWMAGYGVNAYAWVTDLGFPASKVFDVHAKWMIGLSMDSGGVNGPATYSYHTPMRDAAGTGYIQSWTDVKNARTLTSRVARAFNATDTTFRIAEALSSGQDNNTYNIADLYEQTMLPVQVGSELLHLVITTSATVGMTVDPITDVATAAGHTFITGDLVRVHRSIGAGVAAALSVTDAGSLCMYGKFGCDMYVKVLSATQLELYIDSGLTQKVDWTAADAGLYAGQAVAIIANTWQCPTGGLCRGIMGTTPAAHLVGEPFTIVNSVMSDSRVNPTFGVQAGHGANFYAALASAAERGTVYTDSVTGKPITGARAFETYRRWFYGLNYFGGGANCTGLNLYNCDNPMYGYKPRGTPGGVRLVGSNLFYNAPDGAACRYAISATPFTSTDDSDDTASITGPRARSISVSGGTQYYRISCGASGRTTGVVTTP